MISISHAASAFTTSFLASSVEAVEAMTVVLAAGISRGWPSALAGAGAGAAVLGAVVALLGPSIARVPLAALQVTTGVLLLLFGARWLRKAMLRYAGAIPMRDEEVIYARSREQFGTAAMARIDILGALAVFKVVLLEGAEVIVIVVGLGAAGGLLPSAASGALAAVFAVAIAGAALHRPLAHVPENALKLAVGVMVSAFGMFWFGEGVGIHWPYGDAAIPGLIALLVVTAALGIRSARR